MNRKKQHARRVLRRLFRALQPTLEELIDQGNPRAVLIMASLHELAGLFRDEPDDHAGNSKELQS